jgi:hypothetical protein
MHSKLNNVVRAKHNEIHITLLNLRCYKCKQAIDYLEKNNEFQTI